MESLSDERDYNITIDSDVTTTDLSTDLSGTDETEEDEPSSQEVEFTHENNESGQQEVELEKILDEVYEVPSQLRENRVDKIKEGKLLKKVLEKLKISNNIDINIFTDSKPSIQFLNKDYRSKKRDKFIDLKLAKLSEQVRENIIAIEKIPGVTNVADILTKPVTTIQFKKIIECLENKLNPEDILHITELEESKFKDKEKMLMIS
ncbi:Tkp4 protein [Vanderwaltozyma polyspora DSM 70294]|uniref:Tkp4 protein n=1 Tax=Vanderwaltozyma polyspora (strain ATCC 22028 / DSM 70294 / BCRC 21397 / CBS 2163 / NBRC 10782 / NRRL Y-8283 / UCD 57-17) TaxID=436907 RepID=A7TN46_VANPO|nr:Tkp4 protein [Vanderwaltozyma polyspora DSM 70294]EDO16352.1 Tkp4 protein [Vanderwaltozyma polyspora DSM 70294]